MMQYDKIMLVSDMDGTLTDPMHQLYPENAEAVRRFVKGGGWFTIATGREWQAMGEFWPTLETNLPLILVNGAQIYDPEQNLILEQTVMPASFAPYLLKIADEYPDLGIVAITHTGGIILRHSTDSNFLMPPAFDNMPAVSLRDLPPDILKILLYGNEVELADTRRQLDEEQALCQTESEVLLTSSFPSLIDIMPAGVSKGAGLRTLKEKWLPQQNHGRLIVAVGDQENDLPLFAEADLSFAMGQAADDVKAAADFVLPDNMYPSLPLVLERLGSL